MFLVELAPMKVPMSSFYNDAYTQKHTQNKWTVYAIMYELISLLFCTLLEQTKALKKNIS